MIYGRARQRKNMVNAVIVLTASPFDFILIVERLIQLERKIDRYCWIRNLRPPFQIRIDFK